MSREGSQHITRMGLVAKSSEVAGPLPMGLLLPFWSLPCLCALAELNGIGSTPPKVRATAAML